MKNTWKLNPQYSVRCFFYLFEIRVFKIVMVIQEFRFVLFFLITSILKLLL